MIKLKKHERDNLILDLHLKGFTSRQISKALFGRTTCKTTVNRVLNKLRGKKPKSFDKVPEKVRTKEVVETITPSKSSIIQVFKIETSETCPEGGTHFVIPDCQVRDDVNTEYLDWVGKYIVDRKPDLIVNLGDFADMPSLSSYDRGKKKAEGKRVMLDINAAIHGMKRLLKPLYDHQQWELKTYGKIKYKPKMVFTLGNHCGRIDRHVEANPELFGFLSTDDLRYRDFGWEVYDFLKPVTVNGVAYAHFASNPMTGRPYGGSALNMLKNVGISMTVGHKQVLDVATRNLPTTGRQQWFITAGACYTHNEDYKGSQGNHHWRGVIVKHNVTQGAYSPMFVDLDFLEKRFGKQEVMWKIKNSIL